MHLKVSRHTGDQAGGDPRYLTVTHSAKAGALVTKNASVHATMTRMARALSRSVALSFGCLNAGIDFLIFDLSLLFGHFAAIHFSRHFEALRGKELN